MSIKSKSRNRLAAPDHDFRCAVSKVIPIPPIDQLVIPLIDQLVEKKQLHPSHPNYYCVFSHFLVFFQLWADASSIKALLLCISELFNYPNVGGTPT